MTSSGSGALVGALARLLALVPVEDRGAVGQLLRRLDTGVLRVLVAGEAKRGKSTLVNALLGRDVLPTGVLPLTAVVTTVAYGDADLVKVTFRDGRAEQLGLEALGDLVTERGNPGNRRGVASVTVRLASLLLKGVELVDTPGTGSVYAQNTAEAIAALDGMDAGVFVLSADPPVSASEREFLRRVRPVAMELFCVLNKTDHLSGEEDELEQVRTFTEQVLSGELGCGVRLWPVSARAALAARRSGDEAAFSASGLAAFEAAFAAYLSQHRQADLVRSVATRAARISCAAAEQAAATMAALPLSADDLDARLVTFTQGLEEVNRQRAETAGLAQVELDRLTRETDAQAAALPDQVGPEVQAAVVAYLAGLPGPPAERERTALDYAAGGIRAAVEGWRIRRAGELDSAVVALEERLTGRLDGEVRAVREAAASLFDVALPELAPLAGLAASKRFRYAFEPEVGQIEGLLAGVRTRLPASLGRRRVARYVEERTGFLLDRQVGRARADFQERLRQTGREMAAELERRFQQDAGRIADAVSRAGVLRTQRVEHLEAASADLAGRRAAAVSVADELDRYATGGVREVAAGG